MKLRQLHKEMMNVDLGYHHTRRVHYRRVKYT